MVVAGIDPGTTTAVAVIDVKGRLLLLRSMKHQKHAALARMILDAGRPVIIAGDVSSPPALIEKIAASLSAKLFFPEKNMTREEKLKIAEKYSKSVSPDRKIWKNKHERDALASALRAWKRVRHVIDKAYESGESDAVMERILLCVFLEGRSIEECRKRFA